MEEVISNSNKKKKKLLVYLTLCILFLLGAFYLYQIMLAKEDESSLAIDSNVIVGGTENDIQKRREEAQKKVDEGLLGIKMTTTPTFETGDSEGVILIENPLRNYKNFTVQFQLEETGEVVYESGLIPPGSYIKEAKLSTALAKGEYPAIAYFTSYNANGEADGQTGINIVIHILN